MTVLKDGKEKKLKRGEALKTEVGDDWYAIIFETNAPWIVQLKSKYKALLETDAISQALSKKKTDSPQMSDDQHLGMHYISMLSSCYWHCTSISCHQQRANSSRITEANRRVFNASRGVLFNSHARRAVRPQCCKCVVLTSHGQVNIRVQKATEDQTIPRVVVLAALDWHRQEDKRNGTLQEIHSHSELPPLVQTQEETSLK